ncbi:PAS domain S-box protein [Clostridium botulinum]|nr:PAS domain S-box protein [Clostridium botulinum]NFS53443.1 PAS domain S-box protein [Clostridium botulinum]NFT16013.1 PAS domain S-box protein [Clostridium botulinum]
MNSHENSIKRKYTIEDLENILDSIPNCIWTKDKNGEYTYVNKTFSENMNLSKDEIIGKTDFDFGNTKLAKIFDKDDKKVLSRNIPTLSENKIKIQGKKRWFEIYKTPLKRKDNSFPWIMAIARDTTFDKTLDEDLQNLFNANKSYELNNDIILPAINTKDIIDNKNTSNKYLYKLQKIIDSLSSRLKTEGVSLFLYNKSDKCLNLYLNAGKSNINVKDIIPLTNNNIINLNKNIYNNVFEVNKNSIFCTYQKKYQKNNSIHCIRSCSIKYSNDLIGVLNIYYPTNYTPKFSQEDFIKSTCNKLGILIKNHILSCQLKNEFQKRLYIEKELELFLDTATDSCALVDFDGTFLKISNNFTNTLGWNEDELLDKKFQDLIYRDDIEKSNNFRKNVRDSGKFKGSGLIHRYLCKNGQYKTLEWNWNLIQDENHIILTGKDITEEKKLKEEKKHLEETVALETLKTTFFANVSHEFRTPLNIILTAIQLISIKLSNCPCSEEKEKIFQYIRGIKQNSYRLLKLVNNLLDLTKIDGGYYELKLIKCNIVNLIEEIVLSVADHIGSKKREIIFDTTEEEILTSCDPEKIETILLNLLSNAVKFTKENDSIEVNLNVDSYYKNVVVSVKDSGCKIDKEDAKIIFNRFTQLDALLNRRCEGSGIGLALVKSLVDLHGGDIWVNTLFEDGAEIIFTIPIKELESKKISEFHTKTLNANIERYNVEFSDIYNL